MMWLAATGVSCSLHSITGKHKMAEEARTSGQSVDVGQPVQGELIPLLVVLLLFVLVNMLTASRSPTVWQDEVQFTEPAANYVQGKGLTSTAWHLQGAEETCLPINKLHTWLLIPWIYLFGLTPTSVRAVNFLYVAVAALLLWVGVRRLGLIASARLRVALVVAVLSQYAVTFSYRSGRYDALGMMLAGAAVASATLRSQGLRIAALLAIGVLVPITGLQLVPYTVIVAAVLLAFFGRETLRATLPLGAGIAMGGALLYAALHATGTWQRYVEGVNSFPTLGDTMAARLATIANELPRDLTLNDPSVALALAILVFGLAASKAVGFKNWRRVDLAALLLCLAVPVGVGLAGRFPLYYHWMIEVPAIVGAVVVWDRVVRNPSRGLRFASLGIGVVLAMSSAVGLPARLVVTVLEWSRRDYAPVETFVSRYMLPSDVVFASYQGFYALQHCGTKTFYPPYLDRMTPAEKASVKALLIPPEALPDTATKIGGQWQEVDALKGGSGLGAALYNLTLFRRKRG
jgi:hypothetical protein